MRGNRLYYGIIDVGRDVWTARDGSTLGPFIGYQQWSERVDAYGASWPVNFLMNPDLANGVPIISNEVRWRFLRVGLAAKTFLAPKTRLIGELVLIPVAQVRDEDSHWLRTDPSDLGRARNLLQEPRSDSARPPGIRPRRWRTSCVTDPVYPGASERRTP